MSLFRRLFVISIVSIVLVSQTTAVLALSESANYTLQNGAVNVLGNQASSGSYTINSGSISPGGQAQSGNFNTNVGASFSGEVPAVSPSEPAPAGGGGGGFTGETVPPVLESYQVFHVSTNTVRIVYTTSELAVTFAQYSSGATFDQSTPLEMSHATTHEVYLTHLTPGTRYALRFFMRDVAYNTALSKTIFFTTRAELTPVPNVTVLSARSTSKQVRLSWVNPVYEGLRDVVVLRDNQALFAGNATSFVDSTVTPATSYTYTVIIRSVDARQSSGAVLRVVVPTVPVVSTSTPVSPVLPEQEMLTPAPEVVSPKPPITFPLFGPEKPIFIPAQPPALPAEAQPVIDIKKLSNDVITLYSITTQVTEKQTVRFWEAVTSISDASRSAITEQVGDIFDSLGQIDFSKVVTLPKEKIAELEFSLDVRIPDVFLKQPLPRVSTPQQVNQSPTVSSTEQSEGPNIPVIDDEVDGSIVVLPQERGTIELVLQETVVEAPAAPAQQSGSGDWHVVAGGDVFISLPVSLFTQPVQTIIATVGTRAYVLSLSANGLAYEARFSAPEEKGEYEMLVQIIYANNTFDELRNVLLVDPSGYVYTNVLRPWSWSRPWEYFITSEQRLVGATVALYTTVRTGEWSVWPAHLYGQTNPQLSGKDGSYAFIAPPGEYRLVATLDGYERFEGDTFTVIDVPVTKHIRLKTRGVMWKMAVRRSVAIVVLSSASMGIYTLWRIRKKVIH